MERTSRRTPQDGSRKMSRARKSRRPSLFRRLVYLLMLVSGGGAGVGGWVFKDHPRVQALLGAGDGEAARRSSATRISRTRWPRSSTCSSRSIRSASRGPTRSRSARSISIPNLFKAGHTVDIQAKVLRQDGQGRSTTLWDTVSFGERLAVAGKDELIAEWDHRPFQVEWSPGDRLTVEVYDRRAGLFAQPKRFVLATSGARAPRVPAQAGHVPAPARGPEAGSPRRSPQRQHRPREPSRRRPGRRRIGIGPIVARAASGSDDAPHRHQVSPPGRKERAAWPSDCRCPSTVSKARSKPIAVLLTDDGETINIPRSLLPPGVKPGDVLTLTLEHDAEATRKLADETRRVQDKLSQGDPGGDIRL